MLSEKSYYRKICEEKRRSKESGIGSSNAESLYNAACIRSLRETITKKQVRKEQFEIKVIKTFKNIAEERVSCAEMCSNVMTKSCFYEYLNKS